MIKLSFSILIILLVTIFQFCRKEEIEKTIKITTDKVISVSAKNATIKGTIVDIGGGINEYGHVWSTSREINIDNPYTINHGERVNTGSFESEFTDLTPNTIYYVWAYASDGNIAATGKMLSFTTEAFTLATVITGAVNEILPTSVQITGILSDFGNGIDSILQHGHCWSTSQEPTISNNKTELGSRNSTGEFTSDITGLQKDTKYYVRAYVTSEIGTSYGNEISFTTYTRVPAIFTLPISSITGNSAESGGNITDDGGSAITARGVCWGTSQNPTILDNITLDDSGIGSFISSITELSIGTVYYVRAYATNNICTAYGSHVSFTTGQSVTTPTVTTSSASDITETSATIGGNVTNDGGATVTERGVYYSISANPETTGTKLSIGSGTGTYSISLTGLTAGTTYYIKAYAINSQGEALGSEVSFTTNSGSGGETGSFTDTRDSHEYLWVKIGNQLWMAENLAYLPEVFPSSSESYTEPYYYVYGYQGSSVSEAKATSNYATYGVLYNWPAAMADASSSIAYPSGVQGVCPNGWHLPSDAEWTGLTDYLGDTYGAGGKLKETGTTHWNSPNTDATNSSGFTSLPGGHRDSDSSGPFNGLGRYAFFWSATEYGSSNAWYRDQAYDHPDVYRYAYHKSYGHSVRCTKD